MSAQQHHPKSIAAPSIVQGTLPELCDKLLSLIASYPEACARGVRRMTASQDSLRRLAIAFSAIGFEYSRQLFPWITDLQWFMMESHATQAAARSNATAAAGQALLGIFTDLLAESMVDDGAGTEDPFDFLNDLDAGRLAVVLNGESPSSLALIAAFWAPSDMSRVLRLVPESVRIQAILQIARLQRLPDSEAKRAAARFAEHLQGKLKFRPGAAPTPAPAAAAAKPVVRPATTRGRATPPPPPVPRLGAKATSAAHGEAAQNEEALLTALRAEAPELYAELADGDYFRALRQTTPSS